jgi:hypothetical protein
MKTGKRLKERKGKEKKGKNKTRKLGIRESKKVVRYQQEIEVV